jgi:hypothetical protein
MLFWDDIAEHSFDPITGNDFEGYRIYRSTDPGFNDGGFISDARFGNKLWSIPIAAFDLANDIYGINYSIPTLGVQFNLGTDNGIRHYFIDTTAVNGYTYFYAVTSYDHGSVPVDPSTGKRSLTKQDTLQIDPSECAKFVAVQSTGEIEKGTNVVVVRPEANASGYVNPKLAEAGIVSQPQNTATGSFAINFVAEPLIKQNHTYQLSFKDTINDSKLMQTKSYSLTDLTDNTPIITDQQFPDAEDEQHIVVSNTGFKLNFTNADALQIDSAASGFTRGNTFYGWTGLGIPYLRVIPYSGFGTVNYSAADYEVTFSDLGIDSSRAFSRKPSAAGSPLYLPPVKTNFTIIDKKTGQRVPFAFRPYTGKPKDANVGILGFRASNRVDEVILLVPHPTIPDSLLPGWQFSYLISNTQGADTMKPEIGDRVSFNFSKPFLSNDVYQFTTMSGTTDPTKANLDAIKVVPNPYIVTNTWEPRNPYSNGRGEREIHFTHLPPRCTIRIFNIKGQLINILEHDAASSVSQEEVPQFSGTLTWNMLSDDNLEISYGIYIYHVDAPGIGEKIGKFVVIK